MSSSANQQDISFMREVLDLAAQGNASTQPNPRVGCLIVKDGEVIAQGFHESAGQLHAERIALNQAGEQARGATVYVNLEPCCHQGRTPPCTDAIVDAGVSRVVSAQRDPNPMVQGGGYELLNRAGVEVTKGILEDQAIWLNRGFNSRMVRKKPWVILKSAATLDGKTAAFDGQSKWITSSTARKRVQQLRANCSAVLTGIGTVLADDPQLNVRLQDDPRQPYRVVLDSSLKMPLSAKIIGDDHRCLIFTVSQDAEKVSALIERGAEVIQLDDEFIKLEKVLRELAKWQCNEVLVEAGQILCGAFVEQGFVDELALFYAGSVLGDQGRSMFGFNSPLAFENRPEYRVQHVQMLGEDVFLRAVNQQSLDQLGIPKYIESADQESIENEDS